MNVLAIRHCAVSPKAGEVAGFFKALGLPQRNLDAVLPPAADGSFIGTIQSAQV